MRGGGGTVGVLDVMPSHKLMRIMFGPFHLCWPKDVCGVIKLESTSTSAQTKECTKIARVGHPPLQVPRVVNTEYRWDSDVFTCPDRGPNTRTPASARTSTIPATSGTSGPDGGEGVGGWKEESEGRG